MASCYVCIEQGADHVWRPRTREGRAMASCYVRIEQGADHVWRPRTREGRAMASEGGVSWEDRRGIKMNQDGGRARMTWPDRSQADTTVSIQCIEFWIERRVA